MNLKDFGNKKIESDNGGNDGNWFELPPDKDKNRTQWVLRDGDKFLPTGKTLKSLPAEAYYLRHDSDSNLPFFHIINLKNDALIEPSGIISETIKEIEGFWKKRKLFEKHGFLYYRGYLFYGKHGSGKSSVVQLISIEIRKLGGIVIYCEDHKDLIEGLVDFRKIEKERPIVVVFEDIDAIIKKYGEDNVLSYLDGESKIDGVLNIATTNYPELLDQRIVNRPRRFDRIIKIEFPSKGARELYLSSRIDKRELRRWIDLSEGLSFASLAELVIRVKCLDQELGESLSLLKEAQEKKVSSEGDDRVGFDQKEDD